MGDWYSFSAEAGTESIRRDLRFKTGELVHDGKPQGEQAGSPARLRAAIRRAIGRMQSR